jgi:hypothetical protein
MDKRFLFLKSFGFRLDDLIPLSLHFENEINESIIKNIKKSNDLKDYYTNYNKIDIYVYSHEDQSWKFIPNGINMIL